MLYTTNLVALVTGETKSSASKFTILDTLQNIKIYENEMLSVIENVKMYKNG